MLLGNHSVLARLPLRYIGGSATSAEVQIRSNFSTSGANRNRLLMDTRVTALRLYAVPTGNYAGKAWVLPQVVGELASRNILIGSGVFAGSGAMGLNGAAALSGLGLISQALLTLIISASASLSGSAAMSGGITGKIETASTLSGSAALQGSILAQAFAQAQLLGSSSLSALAAAGSGIFSNVSGSGSISQAILNLYIAAAANLSGSGSLSASIVGKLEAVAALAGSGNAQAAIVALGALQAQVTGLGMVLGSPTATGFATANIRGYGDLTPEGIKDAIWNAASNQYSATGSMGSKLNSAASGGIDYAALAQAIWQHANRTLTAGEAPTAATVAAAVLATLSANTIPVDMRKIKGQALSGSGSATDPWGPP